MSKKIIFAVCSVICLTFFKAHAGDEKTKCENLKDVKLEHGTINLATWISEKSFTTPKAKVHKRLPLFCRVTATLKPTVQSDINIEIWLPSATKWNHRFAGTGNGGYAGQISFADLAHTLRMGYAVANTDMGTSPSTVEDGKALFAYPERQMDYGYRSTHEMTIAAKQIAFKFYNASPKYSYFAGCSSGGAQGLAEAEKYPADYDGIVAGAPAFSRTHLAAKILADYKNVHPKDKFIFAPKDLQLVTDEVLKSCGPASGGKPGDQFLSNPLLCHWDPSAIACKDDKKTEDCLSKEQVAALKRIYEGPINPRTKESISPGVERGAELDLTELQFRDLGKSQEGKPVLIGILYWVFGPDWDWHKFDFDKDLERLDQAQGPIANADRVNDLGAFFKRDGKIIAFHGWNDSLIPPREDIPFFAEAQRVAKTQGKDGVRLFMLAGAGHCYGGPGPNNIGGFIGSETVLDPEHDILAALDRWVSNNKPPLQIIGTKYKDDDPNKPALFSRPIYPFTGR